MQSSNDLPLWQDKQVNRILKELCDKHQVPLDILKELVAIERHNQHRERARGIYEEFDAVFEQMD